MKKSVQKVKKVTSKKNAPPYTHTTDEVREYIKEVSTDFDKKITAHIGAVTEDFQHRVSAIAEQFLGLNEKIDRNTETLNEKIDRNTEILNTHTVTLNTHTDMLNTHTDMIGRLMIDMEDVKTGLQQKVGRDEFNKLESRLVSLEAIVLTERSHGARPSKSK